MKKYKLEHNKFLDQQMQNSRYFNMKIHFPGTFLGLQKYFHFQYKHLYPNQFFLFSCSITLNSFMYLHLGILN